MMISIDDDDAVLNLTETRNEDSKKRSTKDAFILAFATHTNTSTVTSTMDLITVIKTIGPEIVLSHDRGNFDQVK